MLDVSRGLSLGDAALLKLARMDLINALREQRQFALLDQLRAVSGPAPHAMFTSAELAEHVLPDVLLSAFANGGLGTLAERDGLIADLISRMKSAELFLDHPTLFAAAAESMQDLQIALAYEDDEVPSKRERRRKKKERGEDDTLDEQEEASVLVLLAGAGDAVQLVGEMRVSMAQAALDEIGVLNRGLPAEYRIEAKLERGALIIAR
jgi:hypothetical protein